MTTTEDGRPAGREESDASGIPGVRAAVRRVLTRMFGRPPFDPRVDPGDPGLTGPGSASWRVIAEPAAIAGGVRALVVQIAHPSAMAGVADHSAFREDPLGRLHRTTAYVTATTFGSTREALAITQRVREVHPRVRGTAPDGRTYRADDPRLLAWVSVALTSSFLVAHRLWAPWRLPDEDRFVREQSRLHALLDPGVDLRALLDDPRAQAELRDDRVALPLLERGELPRTVGELAARLADFGPELRVHDQGREALRFLRRPGIPRLARGPYRVLLAGAVGSLEPAMASALELERPLARRRRDVLRTRRLVATMRATVGTSPSERAARRRATATPSGRSDGVAGP